MCKLPDEKTVVMSSCCSQHIASTVHNLIVADMSARMNIYSAHDTTVFSLLAALNATGDPSTALPVFASNVILELWQLPNTQPSGPEDFSIRVKYNGELLPDGLGCPGGSCSMTDFLSGTKDVVVSPDSCEDWTSPSDRPANCSLNASA